MDCGGSALGCAGSGPSCAADKEFTMREMSEVSKLKENKESSTSLPSGSAGINLMTGGSAVEQEIVNKIKSMELEKRQESWRQL